MTPSQRLLVRLRSLGLDLPDDTRVVHLYASSAQRSAGAWSWCLFGPDGEDRQVGSQFCVTFLLSCRRWAATSVQGLCDVNIDPWSLRDSSGDWSLYLEET